MNLMRIKPSVRRTVLMAYWLAMFISTHWPDISRYRPATGWPIPYFGVVMHVGVYLIWTVLWCWFLAGIGKLTARGMVLLFVGGMGYAGFDEWTQSFVDRSPDPDDFVVDVLGIALGLALSGLIHRRRQGRQSRSR
jgi:VanZ family protein